MKAERRHKLHHNELADWIGEKLSDVQRHGRTITYVLLAAVVMLGVYFYFRNASQARQTEAWTKYVALSSRELLGEPGDFGDILKSQPGGAADLWASLRQANVALDRGLELIYEQPDEAKKLLAGGDNSALNLFDHVLNTVRDPSLRQSAMLGRARTLETLGQLDQAKAEYQRLVDAAPESTAGKMAAQRLASLNVRFNALVYTWLPQAVKDRARPVAPPVGQRPSDDLPFMPAMPNP